MSRVTAHYNGFSYSLYFPFRMVKYGAEKMNKWVQWVVSDAQEQRPEFIPLTSKNSKQNKQTNSQL